jgi:hypothetical protein
VVLLGFFAARFFFGSFGIGLIFRMSVTASSKERGASESSDLLREGIATP